MSSHLNEYKLSASRTAAGKLFHTTYTVNFATATFSAGTFVNYKKVIYVLYFPTSNKWILRIFSTCLFLWASVDSQGVNPKGS